MFWIRVDEIKWISCMSSNQHGGEGVIKISLHFCANHKGPPKLSQKIWTIIKLPFDWKFPPGNFRVREIITLLPPPNAHVWLTLFLVSRTNRYRRFWVADWKKLDVWWNSTPKDKNLCCLSLRGKNVEKKEIYFILFTWTNPIQYTWNAKLEETFNVSVLIEQKKLCSRNLWTK
jgi:hypothetical protein